MLLRKLIFVMLIIQINYLVSLADGSFEGEVSIEARLSKTEVHLNDSTRLDFLITVSGNREAIDLFEPPIPEVSNFKIIGSGASSRVVKEGLVKKCFYYLKPVTVGMAYVEPIKTGYENLETGEKIHLMTKRLSVKILPGVEKEETSFSFAYLLIGLLIVIGGIGFYIFKRKSERNSGVKEGRQENMGPREIAFEKLKELEKDNINNSDKLNEVNQIVVNYFRREYGFPSGLSGREVVSKLSGLGYNDRDVLEIQDYFDQCDLLKFSGSRIDRKDVDEIFFKSKEILALKLTKNVGGENE